MQDLRNHGSSPHARPMTYTHMAADVLDFCHKLSLSNISLLGHSMCVFTAPLPGRGLSAFKRGGKVAMTFALNPETPTDLLKDLIISDITPVRAKASAESISHIQGMEEIEASNISSRKEANEIFEKFEKVSYSRLPPTCRLTGIPGPQCPRISVDQLEQRSITIKVPDTGRHIEGREARH